MIKWLAAWWTTYQVWRNADVAQRGMLLGYYEHPDDCLEERRSRADD
jgi:hypothetical protein